MNFESGDRVGPVRQGDFGQMLVQPRGVPVVMIIQGKRAFLERGGPEKAGGAGPGQAAGAGKDLHQDRLALGNHFARVGSEKIRETKHGPVPRPFEILLGGGINDRRGKGHIRAGFFQKPEQGGQAIRRNHIPHRADINGFPCGGGDARIPGRIEPPRHFQDASTQPRGGLASHPVGAVGALRDDPDDFVDAAGEGLQGLQMAREAFRALVYRNQHGDGGEGIQAGG